jgi:hypothetical protein
MKAIMSILAATGAIAIALLLAVGFAWYRDQYMSSSKVSDQQMDQATATPNCTDAISTVEDLFREFSQKEVDNLPDEALAIQYANGYVAQLGQQILSGQCNPLNGQPCPGQENEQKIGPGTGKARANPLSQMNEQVKAIDRALKASLTDEHYDSWNKIGRFAPSAMTEAEYNKLKQVSPPIANAIKATGENGPYRGYTFKNNLPEEIRDYVKNGLFYVQTEQYEQVQEREEFAQIR